MDRKKKILDILRKRPLILDGATGTELFRRGMPAGSCPEKWVLANPDAIKSVHRDYERAGSDIVYTCTFGANRIKLAQHGLSRVREVNRKIASLTRQAVNKKTMVCGDIGPSGRFIEPYGNLKFEDAVDLFKEQIRGLLSGGVDLFGIETMIDIQEARAALIAVKELTDKFVMVTMTYEKNGRTLNGTDPLSALITLQSLGADAVGCNCSSGPDDMLKIIRSIKPYARVPLVAKPNAGMPKLIQGKTVFDMGAEEFSRLCKGFILAGANMVGGCCGTSPEYIRQLKKRIGNSKPIMPLRKSISALSSASGTVLIEKNRGFVIIGERINPTGKKKMQEEIRKGDLSFVRELAGEQEAQGAHLLDVNVGVAGVNEKEAMVKAVNTLSSINPLPLVIDSSNPEVIALALRLNPGRSLINSISAEKNKIKRLLPLAEKYGAMFILLPLSDKGIPKASGARKKVIKEIFAQAEKFGFTKDDIIVDGLALSIASNMEYAQETLKTIEWCAKVFKCNTLVGLSNISFGMPNRKWINAVFLKLAREKGLNSAIADPESAKLADKPIVKKIIRERKNNVSAIFDYFLKASFKEKGKPLARGVPVEEKISRVVLEGGKEKVEGLIKEAIAKGRSPYQIIERTVVPAIVRAGELFDKRQYFLPQLIASAETVKRAFDFLEPYIKKDRSKRKQKAMILMATVKGDIHDIGKNIVVLILESNSFRVIDLGKDISPARIISAIKRFKPDIVGLSALMTTTMIKMPEVIGLARKEGLKCKFLVGGAVVNKNYAREIGAEYAHDAIEAVRLAGTLSKT